MKKTRLAELVNMARSLYKIHPNYGVRDICYSFICQSDGGVVAFGTNRDVPHSTVSKRFKQLYDKSVLKLHSELDALYRVRDSYVRRSTFVNVRLLRNGRCGSAKPSVHCLAVLWALGVKKVYYTNSAGDFEYITL